MHRRGIGVVGAAGIPSEERAVSCRAEIDLGEFEFGTGGAAAAGDTDLKASRGG